MLVPSIISICILSLICSKISICLGIYTLIRIKAQDLSTHKMEYVPFDPSWGTSDKEIEKIEKFNGAIDLESSQDLI